MSITAARADVPVVRARMTPDTILIGDRAELTIEVQKDMMQVIDFPHPDNGRFGDRIEVLADLLPDTVKGDGRQMTLSKRYVITSFDEGQYNFPPMPVLYLDKNIADTLYTAEQLRLTVLTIPVDTLTQTIYDIKAPLQTPVLVGEFAGYVILAVVLAALLTVVIWLSAHRKRKQQTLLEQRPKEPPHIRAIRELEQLNNQKVWQNHHHKQYYTRLTDILREYIDGRWGVNAMEMTSDQLLDSLKEEQIELSDKSFGELRELLKEADLVKFAKHIPEAAFNESAYYKAYYFVEETKQVQEQKAEQPARMVDIDTTAKS